MTIDEEKIGETSKREFTGERVTEGSQSQIFFYKTPDDLCSLGSLSDTLRVRLGRIRSRSWSRRGKSEVISLPSSPVDVLDK